MTADGPADLGGGVFISHVATEDFESDPDISGTEQHVLYAGPDLSAGMSRASAGGGLLTWTLPQREFLLVLEGTARIEIKDGPTLALRAGDMATLPAGAETTWHVSPSFKEFWVLG
jgi:uncharacterized cupin superfamily protein